MTQIEDTSKHWCKNILKVTDENKEQLKLLVCDFINKLTENDVIEFRTGLNTYASTKDAVLTLHMIRKDIE